MESIPLTVCPSQLQLQSTDDQSLAAVEARLLQSFIDEGFITDMTSLDNPPPFPLSDLDLTDISAFPPAPPFEEDDFFRDLPSSSTHPPPFNLEEDLPADLSAALLESWDAADQHQPVPPAADADYEALFCSGAAPVVPVAVGQAPVTPESSTRRSSGDGLGEPAPCGWGWDPVSVPGKGAFPGYMTPPGSGMAMAMAMEMEMGEVDWEALSEPAAPPPPPAPTLAPAPAPAPTPTSISPTLTSPTTAPTSTTPSPTKTKTKTKASDRRERKVVHRRRREATKPAPGTIVFAPNIVPPPEVYVSAYSHTREYCLDERGRVLKRRRYEDKN